MYTFSVSRGKVEKKDKCLLCKKRITDDEFAYEDYFMVFRGHTEKAFEGVICFACLKE